MEPWPSSHSPTRQFNQGPQFPRRAIWGGVPPCTVRLVSTSQGSNCLFGTLRRRIPPQRHSNERTPPLQAKIFETGREWSCLALRETLGSGHQHMSKVVGMPPSWIWQVWHSHPIRRHHLQRVHVCGRGTSPVSTCTYGWTGACENIDRRGEGETLAPNNPHKLNSHLVCRVQHASRSANCLVDRGPSGPSPDSPRSGFAEIRWAFCTGGVEHESQLLARSRITLPALAG